MPTAVITGTSSGIGLAAAIAFAQRGYTTVATMRNLERSSALRKAAETAKVGISIEAMDVCNDASVETRIREIRERTGSIDVLVNNAGIGGAGPLEIVPEAEHRAIFETNYWGVVRTVQAVITEMRERGSGAIVNVSSGAGLMATPNQVPYGASKWALEGMSETLAYELRPFGVRVVLIEPGIVATKIFENSAQATHYDKTSPYRTLMRRSGLLFGAGFKNPGRPEYVAEVIVDAVESETHQLRHIVGDDAEKLVSGHRSVSSEDFLAMSELDDEAFKQRYKEVYGIDL